MNEPAAPLTETGIEATSLQRAIETDRVYFEQAAELRQLDGATLAWMPGLTSSPAAAVMHRVSADTLAAAGAAWAAAADRAFATIGAKLARIYLDERHTEADEVLRRAGYVDREELVFVGNLPDPPPGFILRPVRSDANWEQKLNFHRAVEDSPDGHDNRPEELVAVERRKCGDGMEAFLAESQGEILGAIGFIRGDRMMRVKNVVVHQAHRRRLVASSMLAHVAAMGRAEGIFEQCTLAVKGEVGELVYRAAGMSVVGAQVEWSKRIG